MTEAADTQADRILTEIKEAKIVAPKERHIDVPLDWPIEFDGKTYDSVRIRRVTGREVEQFLSALAAAKEGALLLPPPMLDCPIEVYDALDDDDRFKIEEAMLSFFPRRMREAGASILATSTILSDG